MGSQITNPWHFPGLRCKNGKGLALYVDAETETNSSWDDTTISPYHLHNLQITVWPLRCRYVSLAQIFRRPSDRGALHLWKSNIWDSQNFFLSEKDRRIPAPISENRKHLFLHQPCLSMFKASQRKCKLPWAFQKWFLWSYSASSRRWQATEPGCQLHLEMSVGWTWGGVTHVLWESHMI